MKIEIEEKKLETLVVGAISDGIKYRVVEAMGRCQDTDKMVRTALASHESQLQSFVQGVVDECMKDSVFMERLKIRCERSVKNQIISAVGLQLEQRVMAVKMEDNQASN